MCSLKAFKFWCRWSGNRSSREQRNQTSLVREEGAEPNLRCRGSPNEHTITRPNNNTSDYVMCVCIYVCIIILYVYIHTVHMYMCVCIYIYIYIYTHTHIHIHVNTCVYNTCAYIYIYICMYVCIYIYIHNETKPCFQKSGKTEDLAPLSCRQGKVHARQCISHERNLLGWLRLGWLKLVRITLT